MLATATKRVLLITARYRCARLVDLNKLKASWFMFVQALVNRELSAGECALHVPVHKGIIGTSRLVLRNFESLLEYCFDNYYYFFNKSAYSNFLRCPLEWGFFIFLISSNWGERFPSTRTSTTQCVYNVNTFVSLRLRQCQWTSMFSEISAINRRRRHECIKNGCRLCRPCRWCAFGTVIKWHIKLVE